MTASVIRPTVPPSVPHTAPPTASAASLPSSVRERFAAGAPFHDFVAAARANVDLWRAVFARASVSDDAVARVAALGGPWHLLVLAEDWCGDAVNSVPVIARLVERSPNLDLRILARDANLGLMDAHLTGGSRSIPVLILYDAEFQERGWWGPRPRALQSWVGTAGRSLDKESRYREVRRWYARDRGAAIVDEVISLVEHASRQPLPAAPPSGLASISAGHRP